jgi:hypothetical protein
MRGLDPRIHVLWGGQGVDGRDKPGHDDLESPSRSKTASSVSYSNQQLA